MGVMVADQLTELARDAAREEQQRIERAIRGAIRAGYDGVDVNRDPGLMSYGIESVVPWSYPSPEDANGYRTERYTWDYFSDGELTRLLTEDEIEKVVDND